MKAKRITALLLTAVMSIGVLGGCGAKNVDADEVVVKMADGEEVRLGVANFMARYTQSNFDSFYVGSNDKSGLFMPDLEKLAYAYQIPYLKIEKAEDIEEQVKRAMQEEGPVICDIIGSLWFDEIPKCISSVDEKTGKRVSAYLENPYPYLSENERKEIEKELLNV